MNIIVALLVAIDYINAGKSYIQYAWFVAAIMSTVALVVLIKRRKSLPE